jgi:hypothetical protein
VFKEHCNNSNNSNLSRITFLSQTSIYRRIFQRLRSSRKSSLSALRGSLLCLFRRGASCPLFLDEQPLVAGLPGFSDCRQRAAPLRTATLPRPQKVVLQKSPNVSPLFLDMLQDFPNIVKKVIKSSGRASRKAALHISYNQKERHDASTMSPFFPFNKKPTCCRTFPRL